MRLNYDEETDSLYIDLASSASAESQEIADGLVVDYDLITDLIAWARRDGDGYPTRINAWTVRLHGRTRAHLRSQCQIAHPI